MMCWYTRSVGSQGGFFSVRLGSIVERSHYSQKAPTRSLFKVNIDIEVYEIKRHTNRAQLFISALA
jgi:hypothetical protein